MALTGSSARRYAEAMLDLAVAEQGVDRYRTSLEDLAGALEPRTLRRLGDPSTPVERRLAAAADAIAGQPESVRGLVRLLIERDRIALLPRIAQAFGELVDERSGIAKALITTATSLDEDGRQRAVQRLERATGRTIQAEFTVDPALIGGATVRVGDHLIDASLRTRLDLLREEMTR